MSSTVDFEETFGQTCPLSLTRWKYSTDRQSCREAGAVLGVRLRRSLCHLIINPHEAARLMPVAPDLNLMITAKLCLNYFAANRRRCLLPAASIGSLWPIDVVITRNAGFQPEVFAKVPAHSFRK